MKLKKKTKKGFTLIELLIVVAIIAILAAIAIPQFAKYRIRGYNSAADSDLRNMKIAIEAFATDNTAYASTDGCTTPTGGATTAACTGGTPATAAALVGGPVSYKLTVTTGTINTTPTNVPSTQVDMVFGLSNNVSAGVATGTAGADYVAVAAHSAGDTIYGSASKITSLMRSGKDSGGVPCILSDGVAGYALSFYPSSTGDPTADLGSTFTAM